MDNEVPSGEPAAGGVPALSAGVSLTELEAQITALAGQLNAAQYRWLLLIGEFDRRLGWADGRLASCAHWLNFKCGLNLGAARERVRVAHALESLPKIAASMGRGELSYSKVRALTRVACAATEETLLMIGLHGTAHHVERLVRGYRQAQQAEERAREARQHLHRSFSYWFDEDGSLIFKGRLPALGGAVLIQALEAAMQCIPEREISTEVVAEQTIGYPERRADALAAVAEGYLAAKDTASSSPDRYQVVVHVDAETLQERTAGRCQIEGGPSIPAETVRRVSCDASLIRVLEDAQGQPLDVGRKVLIDSLPDGSCRFLHPDGRHFEITQRTRYELRDWAEEWDEQYPVEPNAAATRWRGERIDYELGVWVLCNQSIRAKQAADCAGDAAADGAGDAAGDGAGDAAGDGAGDAAGDARRETSPVDTSDVATEDSWDVPAETLFSDAGNDAYFADHWGDGSYYE